MPATTQIAEPTQAWSLTGSDTVVQIGTTCFVASTNDDYPMPKDVARLIAAAPELLAACQLALELTDCIQDEEGFSPSVSIPAAALRAAIARATGK